MTTHRIPPILSRTLAALLALAISLPAREPLAADTPESPPEQRSDPDFEAGERAVRDGQWKSAIERLGKAVRRDPGNADAFNLLGYAQRNAGDLDGALRSYEEALRLNPDHRGAHEYIGQTYVMLGDRAKAERHLAALARICGTGCEEHRSLKKALDAPPGKAPAAGTRRAW